MRACLAPRISPLRAARSGVTLRRPPSPRAGDVGELLDRDRAAAGVAADAVDVTAFDDSDDLARAEAAVAADSKPTAQPAETTRRTAAAENDPTAPRTCRAALDAGEEALRAGDAAAALALFERALDLPGSAAVRAAGSVVETSCPSDAEEAAALYNAACAYVALGQTDAAVTMLTAALETGAPPDAATVFADPDLAPLGRARLQVALDAAAKAKGGGLGGLFGKGDAGKAKAPSWFERVLRPW